MAKRGPREPKPLGDLLPTLVAGRGWGERMALGRLRDGWAAVAGEHIARRSEPVKLFRGTLTVRAEAGVWASELTLLATSLAAKADAFLGSSGTVKQVRIAAAPGRPAPS